MCRKAKLAVKRQDGFIGDGWIVKAQRAVKIPVARDAMSVRCLRQRQKRCSGQSSKPCHPVHDRRKPRKKCPIVITQKPSLKENSAVQIDGFADEWRCAAGLFHRSAAFSPAPRLLRCMSREVWRFSDAGITRAPTRRGSRRPKTSTRADVVRFGRQ